MNKRAKIYGTRFNIRIERFTIQILLYNQTLNNPWTIFQTIGQFQIKPIWTKYYGIKLKYNTS